MFYDVFVTVARANHLSLSSERSYWCSARSYIKWIGAKSSKDLEADPTGNFRKFLSNLANVNPERENGNEGVSASTQNLHFHAIRFLYEKVVGIPLGDLSNIPKATGHQRIVEVPSEEVSVSLVASVVGINGIILRTIYGTGGRLNDILKLRIKDLDFERSLISIQESKGGKSRLVPMPKSVSPELYELCKKREKIHVADLACGLGWVHLPGRLDIKYPDADKSLAWQYLFASEKISTNPRTGNKGRHHIQSITIQRAFGNARRRLKIENHYTVHSLRHAAAHYWERHGVSRSQIQGLLGHSHSNTTDRYLVSGIKSVANVPTPI